MLMASALLPLPVRFQPVSLIPTWPSKRWLVATPASLPTLASFATQVRDWYAESFKELREFPTIKDGVDEQKFTGLLRSIYKRHANVVPVMARGVSELKKEMSESRSESLTDMYEIHQFLDGFYLSRIGIRILIGTFWLGDHTRVRVSMPSLRFSNCNQQLNFVRSCSTVVPAEPLAANVKDVGSLHLSQHALRIPSILLHSGCIPPSHHLTQSPRPLQASTLHCTSPPNPTTSASSAPAPRQSTWLRMPSTTLDPCASVSTGLRPRFRCTATRSSCSRTCPATCTI